MWATLTEPRWSALHLGLAAAGAVGVSFLWLRGFPSDHRAPTNQEPQAARQARANNEDSAGAGTERRLAIVHFNDVYNVGERRKEPVGGAARFVTLVHRLREQHGNVLVLFSGDALNPSMLSQSTRGRHMVRVLNAIGVNFACVGNHDLDFGEENLQVVVKASQFPWLLTNIFCKHSNKPLGGAVASQLFTWNGIKVGLLGIAELEWIRTAHVNEDALAVYEPVTTARVEAQRLREEGAELVIALSHMREHNDMKLALEVEELDLVLGGHDHHYATHRIVHKTRGTECTVVKSGTDFRELTLVNVTLRDGAPHTTTERFECTSRIPPDAAIQRRVDAWLRDLQEAGNKVIGASAVDLDGRFQSIRHHETNLGNFVADVMLRAVDDADVALLNSGSLRIDQVIPKGTITNAHLSAMLPMLDPMVVLELKGADLIGALENGVSQFPALEGRFLCVAGIRFQFDPSKPAGRRVVEGSVVVGDCALDPQARYRVVTTKYLADGKDGFASFLNGRVVVDQEDGPLLNTALRNHFTMACVTKILRTTSFQQRELARKVAAKWRQQSFHGSSAIRPVVDGRVVCVDHPLA